MGGRGRGRGRGGASKTAYSMAKILPVGEVLVDLQKQRWLLDKPFASGGFGQIYRCRRADDGKAKGKGISVMKVEPAENGPLFSEIHIYSRIGKAASIADFKKTHKLSFLGVAPLLGSGTHRSANTSLRFLVMPLYGSDLENVREKRESKRFDVAESLTVARSCVDILHYLHNYNVVHADLKGDNLLLPADCSTNLTLQHLQRVTLVDFGLARRFVTVPKYQEQPKKGHDGTLIFTSIDAHRGCATTYRTDTEILAYNILYWCTGELPWNHLQSTPVRVQGEKEQLRKNPRTYLAQFLKSHGLADVATFFEQTFDTVFGVEYGSKPDYALLKNRIASQLLKLIKQRRTSTSSSTPSAAGSSTAASVRSTKKRKSIVLEDSPASPSTSSSSAMTNGRRRQQPASTSRGRRHSPLRMKNSTPTDDDDSLVSDVDLFDASPTPSPSPPPRPPRSNRKKAVQRPIMDESPMYSPASPSVTRKIPGLSNFAKLPRKSMVARALDKRRSVGVTLVRKYVRKPVPAAPVPRRKAPRDRNPSPRPLDVAASTSTQTSPGLALQSATTRSRKRKAHNKV